MDKFCYKCGAELVNGVCPKCAQATQNGVQSPQPNMQYQQQNYQYLQQPTVTVNPHDERFKSFFTRPDEKFVCALGNGYLLSFLSSGFIGNGFAVVSDKRVYFKGNAYEIGSTSFKRRSQSSTVDLKDVTGTDVRALRNLKLLFIAIGATMAAFLFLFIVIANYNHLHNSDIQGYVAMISLFAIAGLITFILFMLKKTTFLTINYAGGSIAFRIGLYSSQECENFQKMLRIAKDKVVEEAENATANTMREAMATVVAQPQAAISSADELAKYAQLYKDGLISEQEFADVKAKIFAKH